MRSKKVAQRFDAKTGNLPLERTVRQDFPKVVLREEPGVNVGLLGEVFVVEA
ncbi:hypothetical protein G8770_13260 [Aestuariicella hydrocarbonica]|uniref:Uncharacterized protein n=1 Tax=Pseudomaricurvus hydrocarbonicus TaxID=1470433 RepID=A0A9E5JW03_9GAMM|nr:hypothetical protein [Aestuariicella hydrocarbonica]NHO66511.1 hypothetical protein [Aestuariicella hydrocarbonica]